MKKVHQAGIGIRVEGKVTDDGGHSQGVGTDHKADNKYNKPLKRSISGEAGTEG